MRLVGALVDLVSRVPARVQAKLLVAFLAIATLLVTVGAVGLQGLREVYQRTEPRALPADTHRTTSVKCERYHPAEARGSPRSWPVASQTSCRSRSG
jgi:hypothetical protein